MESTLGTRDLYGKPGPLVSSAPFTSTRTRSTRDWSVRTVTGPTRPNGGDTKEKVVRDGGAGRGPTGWVCLPVLLVPVASEPSGWDSFVGEKQTVGPVSGTQGRVTDVSRSRRDPWGKQNERERGIKDECYQRLGNLR